MGKRKIQASVRIEDNNARRITYLKRKKGLVKKAMELSMLCEQKVMLAIYDENVGKLVFFSSHDDFDVPSLQKVLHKSRDQQESYLECYSNMHYQFISESKIRVDRNLDQFPGPRKLNELPKNFVPTDYEDEDEQDDLEEQKMKESSTQQISESPNKFDQNNIFQSIKVTSSVGALEDCAASATCRSDQMKHAQK